MSRSVMNSFIPSSIVLFRVNCSTILLCVLGICLRAEGLAGCPNANDIQWNPDISCPRFPEPPDISNPRFPEPPDFSNPRFPEPPDISNQTLFPLDLLHSSSTISPPISRTLDFSKLPITRTNFGSPATN